ncbi:MAG TPA: hypothetical protein PKY53_04770 [Clostridia bacterium]|nr:hypothetical protein [Clostridia bacterium]
MRRPYLRNDVAGKVTRYNYPITAFSGIDADAKEDSLALNYGVYGYNIAVRNGVLTDGMGIESPSYDGSHFPETRQNLAAVRSMFVYKHFDYANGVKNDRLIGFYDDGQVYQGSFLMTRLVPIERMTFTSRHVTFLNYYADERDYLCAIGDNGEMKLYDGFDVTDVSDCPALSDACVHYGRIYGVVDRATRIYFSAPLDPANWNHGLTEGGYIALTDEGGQVKRIVSFKDSLYIFREYAVYRLVAYADQTEFTLSKVFTGDNKIYSGSVTVCGDRIVFLADDGFYSFDGYTCKKVLRNIFPLIENGENAAACCFNHRYYIALKMRTDEKVVGDERETDQYIMTNNAVISYDLDLGEVSIFRGADVGGFIPYSAENVNKLYVHFNMYYRIGQVGVITETGRLFGQSLHKKWVSPRTNFEIINLDKVLKKIYIRSAAPVKLTARMENDVEYNLSASYSAQMVPVNRRADKIGLVIETDADNFAVSGMILEFDLIRSRKDE